MKKKDLAELFQKEEGELLEILKKKRKEWLEEKLKIKKGEVKNVHLAKSLKKEIAQILTILNLKKTEKNTKGS